MTDSVFLEVGALIVSLGSIAVAWLSFQHARNKDISEENKARIQGIARDLIGPVEHLTKANEAEISKVNDNIAPALVKANEKISSLNGRLGTLEVRLTQAAENSNRVSPLSDRIGVLETKIDVFWKNVAYDAAKILHSPHTPELDVLLEGFQDGTLTRDQLTKLISMLHKVRDSKDRAVLNGDKVAAAILLRVLEQQIH